MNWLKCSTDNFTYPSNANNANKTVLTAVFNGDGVNICTLVKYLILSASSSYCCFNSKYLMRSSRCSFSSWSCCSVKHKHFTKTLCATLPYYFAVVIQTTWNNACWISELITVWGLASREPIVNIVNIPIYDLSIYDFVLHRPLLLLFRGPVEPPSAVDVSLLLRRQSGTACQKQPVLQHLWYCSESHWRWKCSRDPTLTNLNN